MKEREHSIIQEILKVLSSSYRTANPVKKCLKRKPHVKSERCHPDLFKMNDTFKNVNQVFRESRRSLSFQWYNRDDRLYSYLYT
jgi:hypothetical protein